MSSIFIFSLENVTFFPTIEIRHPLLSLDQFYVTKKLKITTINLTFFVLKEPLTNHRTLIVSDASLIHEFRNRFVPPTRRNVAGVDETVEVVRAGIPLSVRCRLTMSSLTI